MVWLAWRSRSVYPPKPRSRAIFPTILGIANLTVFLLALNYAVTSLETGGICDHNDFILSEQLWDLVENTHWDWVIPLTLGLVLVSSAILQPTLKRRLVVVTSLIAAISLMQAATATVGVAAATDDFRTRENAPKRRSVTKFYSHAVVPGLVRCDFISQMFQGADIKPRGIREDYFWYGLGVVRIRRASFSP